jgi:glycine/D-amino acid oxidase-like deaminating enzyme
VIEELKNNALRVTAGISVHPIYIAENKEGVQNIPKEYMHLYTLVPQEDVLSLLETKDTQYVAVTSERKGCVNSAMLVEEIVGYLLSTYSSRFVLVEETFVSEVLLHKNNGELKTKNYTIMADKIVLCTNGFEKFKITNMAGGDVDAKFHHMVTADIGYMAAYLEELKHPPIALQYFDKKEACVGDIDAVDQDPYFYFTRRPFELEARENHNLVCVGGPEKKITNSSEYLYDGEYMKGAEESIENFLHKTYVNAPKEKIDFTYKWHGLMGYTSTSLRVVGEEPKNRVLMYNLGCNGVGILTSIYGGKRISEVLAGKLLPPSLFDPQAIYD